MHTGFHWLILEYEVDKLATGELKVNAALIFIKVMVILLDPILQRFEFIGKNVFAYNKGPF